MNISQHIVVLLYNISVMNQRCPLKSPRQVQGHFAKIEALETANVAEKCALEEGEGPNF